MKKTLVGSKQAKCLTIVIVRAPLFRALLIQNGAIINAKSCKDDSTPLHVAISSKSIELAKMLLEQGADLEAKMKIKYGTKMKKNHKIISRKHLLNYLVRIFVRVLLKIIQD